ncbi:hypothetical protein [Thermoflexus sp.]|uniref:hypothetical protein n=1 Tax=Thermoflexus sp. TaxID=1969742 RepID=UPI002ADE39F3|nr:hypothetical protein [Thermoflexus sp.]
MKRGDRTGAFKAAVQRGLWGAGGLALFLFALLLMRAGAAHLTPALAEAGKLPSPWHSLGLGWLMACLALSGSPVAAAAISLQDARMLSPAATLTMLTGSRLGASFILFVIGLSYAWRRGHSWNSLTAGLVTFWVTATTYLPATALGLFLLPYVPVSWIARWRPPFLPALLEPFRALVQMVEGILRSGASRWLGRPVPESAIGISLFLLGFFLVGVALQALDRALPLPRLTQAEADPPQDSPWPIFGLGLAVTALTMSVSVSIGLLVPSVTRGRIQREQLIPYVMGANISTFIDTLLAALALGNPAAVGVVLTEVISVSVISAGILLAGYRWYRGLLIRVFELAMGRRMLLGLFLIAFLGVPLILLWRG